MKQFARTKGMLTAVDSNLGRRETILSQEDRNPSRSSIQSPVTSGMVTAPYYQNYALNLSNKSMLSVFLYNKYNGFMGPKSCGHYLRTRFIPASQVDSVTRDLSEKLG